MAKLLVSDDDSQVLEVVSLILEGAGHQVVTARNPRDVLPLASQTPLDVIILDVDMPVSGFELLGQLRSAEATSSVPILFLSGLSGGADRVRGLREGADDYLVKPFEPEELVLRVERLVSWNERSGPVRTQESLPVAEEPPEPEATPGSIPLRLGRYEVFDVIGQGSMGTVYRGHDPRLERPVALKTIRLDTARGRHRLEMLERLRREAVTVARFSHPNIVAVYDMGDEGSSAYIAMELVEGRSLRELLQDQGPLPAKAVLPLAVAVARGLTVAHSGEVIHRDVKPGNVLLGWDGAIKVSDFGLAFILSSLAQHSTEVSGTPGHVPPEVLSQKSYTAKGDLFGLGATLYETLTGVHPLAGPTLRDTILNTMHGRIRPLSEVCPDLPPALAALITDLLAFDPEARPSARQVVEIAEREAGGPGQLRWSPELLQPPSDH